MMSKIKKYFFSKIRDLYKSIAFLPSIIPLIFIAAAVAILQVDSTGKVKEITKLLPLIEYHEINKFVDILSTLLTGMISLTIFSFSMVMVVLNQAATSYTPKVLSIIVEQRSNQFVLGFYIGTIIFYIIVLIFISDAEVNEVSRWLTFYLSVLFAIISILLFVNFIHNVSKSVQIRNIILKIFAMTKEKMKQKERKEGKSDEGGKKNREFKYKYKSLESGYLQSYLSDFPKYLKEKNLIIKIEAKFGEYLLIDNDLFSVDKEIDDEIREEIQYKLIFNPSEDISDHSSYGFYQLSEIAVKALSPGINNIGIALVCIDYLTDLFSIKAENLKSNYVYDDEDNLRIIAGEISVHEIFFRCYTHIKDYGYKSIAVVERLLRSFQKLALSDLDRGLYKDDILKQIESIIVLSDKTFITPNERKYLNEIINSLNQYPDNYFRLSPLKHLTQ
jgi:uncharacterized membrane protein